MIAFAKFYGVVKNNSGFSGMGGQEKEVAYLGNFFKELLKKGSDKRR